MSIPWTKKTAGWWLWETSAGPVPFTRGAAHRRCRSEPAGSHRGTRCDRV